MFVVTSRCFYVFLDYWGVILILFCCVFTGTSQNLSPKGGIYGASGSAGTTGYYTKPGDCHDIYLFIYFADSWSPWRWGAEFSLRLLPLNTRSGYNRLAVSPEANGVCSCAEGGRRPVRGGSDEMREEVRKGGNITATA